MTIHYYPLYLCPICGAIFHTAGAVDQHYTRCYLGPHHPAGGETVTLCRYCKAPTNGTDECPDDQLWDCIERKLTQLEEADATPPSTLPQTPALGRGRASALPLSAGMAQEGG